MKAFPSDEGGGFRHEALLYTSEDEYLTETTAFIRDGLAAGEPTAVAVAPSKMTRLRKQLGGDADRVVWIDVTGIGSNPARITSLWQEFASKVGDRGSLRGIGEHVWPGRTPAELSEIRRHEELCNLALAAGPRFYGLCPYDVRSLDPAVIADVRRSHPLIRESGVAGRSADYLGEDAFARPFDVPVPEPATTPLLDLAIQGASPVAVHRLLLDRATDSGFRPAAAEALALAVLAANDDLQNEDAPAWLRLWPDADRLICEVRSSITLQDPLAGRRPPSQQAAARGLWLANQICDLVQLRSFSDRTVARFHVIGR